MSRENGAFLHIISKRRPFCAHEDALNMPEKYYNIVNRIASSIVYTEKGHPSLPPKKSNDKREKNDVGLFLFIEKTYRYVHNKLTKMKCSITYLFKLGL